MVLGRESIVLLRGGRGGHDGLMKRYEVYGRRTKKGGMTYCFLLSSRSLPCRARAQEELRALVQLGLRTRRSSLNKRRSVKNHDEKRCQEVCVQQATMVKKSFDCMFDGWYVVWENVEWFLVCRTSLTLSKHERRRVAFIALDHKRMTGNGGL